MCRSISTCVFNAGVCKFNGKYVMLFRNDVGAWGKAKFHTTNLGLAFSDDGLEWEVEPRPVWDSHDPALTAGTEHFSYVNDKIGPAALPVKTKHGWLTTVHCVDRDPSRGKNGWQESWKKRYTAGLMLLDLDQPWKIVGL